MACLEYPAGYREIPENSVSDGAVEGTTSWGKPGYSGPCPPSGTHRYFFKLFALDIALDLPPSATTTAFAAAIRNHIIAQAQLIARYSKK